MTNGVVIVGAGGHGKVVADILRQAHRAGSPAVPIGFVDDNDSLHGTRVAELEVQGSIAQLSTIAHDAIVLAIGDNRRRRLLFEMLSSTGEKFATVCHPVAIVGSGVTIGEGSAINAGVVINCDTRIGQNVVLNTSCSVDHDCVVENHAHIAPGVHLGGDVWIEEEVLVGIGATIIPGCRIGARAIIGAGACVTRSVAAGITVVGVPARPLVDERSTARTTTARGRNCRST